RLVEERGGFGVVGGGRLRVGGPHDEQLGQQLEREQHVGVTVAEDRAAEGEGLAQQRFGFGVGTLVDLQEAEVEDAERRLPVFAAKVGFVNGKGFTHERLGGLEVAFALEKPAQRVE